MTDRWILGTMTGTSLDALDISLVRVKGQGLESRAEIKRHATHDLGDVRDRLRAACNGSPLSARDWAALALDFGCLHASAMKSLAGDQRIDLAAVHGQTVVHAPPLSWQMVNPWPIAHALQCPVVSDLRGADLAADGQGAPITPLADWILFRHHDPTAVINLGGFCNMTWLASEAAGPQTTRGADICPCNHLLDAACRIALGQPFDRNGDVALSGKADETAMADLMNVLRRATNLGRSLGTGDEGMEWIDRTAKNLAPAVLLATVARAVGTHIGQTAMASSSKPRRVVIAGGGARNRALREAIATAIAPVRLCESTEFGVPNEARESAEIAILGALAWDGIEITLDHITGRRANPIRHGQWCLPKP